MKPGRKVWDWRTIILHNGPDNATYKHLLLTLSCYMDSAGQSCFPSISTLEKTTSLTRPTLVKYLKKAKDDGWIIVEQKKSENNVWQRNEYTASLPEMVVKEINHPVVKEVNGVVNEVNQGSKGGLPGVVKEVNSISSTTSTLNSSDNSKKDRRELVKKILNGIGKPDFANELFEVPGFSAKYLDYWMYRNAKYDHWPDEYSVKECYQELLKLLKKGNNPIPVIGQTIRTGNTDFIPVRENRYKNNNSEEYKILDGGTW